MRWGILPPTGKLRDCAWKKLYIQVTLLAKKQLYIWILGLILNESYAKTHGI